MEENNPTPFARPHSSPHAHAEVVDEARVMGNGYSTASANSNPSGLTLTDPSAVIALIFAVLSWVLLPVLGALIALGLAPGAKRRIRESNGALGGARIASAAQAIAIANLLAAALLIYLMIQLIKWIF
jgi:hypothetical protein